MVAVLNINWHTLELKMKKDKSTHIATQIRHGIDRSLESNKLKYIVLFLLAYLIAMTISSCDVQASNKMFNHFIIGGDSTQTVATKFHQVFIKVKINPAYHLPTDSYDGFPIDILSSDNDLIARGALDKNGVVSFGLLIPVGIGELHIFSPITNNKLTINNPVGSATVGFYVSALDNIDLKTITNDKDNDGIFDRYDQFPKDNKKAFKTRIPYTGYVQANIEDNWSLPGTGTHFKTDSAMEIVSDRSGKVVAIDYLFLSKEDGSANQDSNQIVKHIPSHKNI